MIVIIKYEKITMLEHFKWKSIGYWFCILKHKLKGADVSVLKESDIK